MRRFLDLVGDFGLLLLIVLGVPFAFIAIGLPIAAAIRLVREVMGL